MTVSRVDPRKSGCRWYHFGKSFRATLLLLYTSNIIILGIALGVFVVVGNSNSAFKAKDSNVSMESVTVRLTTILEDVRRELLIAEGSVLLIHTNPQMFTAGKVYLFSECPPATEEDYEFMLYRSGRTGMSADRTVNTSFYSLSKHLYLFNTEGLISQMQLHIQTADEDVRFFMPVNDQTDDDKCDFSDTQWSIDVTEQEILFCRGYSDPTINLTISARIPAAAFQKSIDFDNSFESLDIRAASNNTTVLLFSSGLCDDDDDDCADMTASTSEWQYSFDSNTSITMYLDYRIQQVRFQFSEMMASLLFVLFLLAAFATKSRIDDWCHRYFSIVNNICNILRTSLEDAFEGKPPTRDIILLTEVDEIQELADRFLSLSTNLSIPKKSDNRQEVVEPFRHEARLKTLVDSFRAHIAPAVIASVEGPLNNKDILHSVKLYWQEQEKIFKELLIESTAANELATFYNLAYNSLIMRNNEQFKKFALEQATFSNGQLINFFYYVNNVIRTKSPSQFIEMGVSNISQLLEDTPQELRDIALFRVQSILLGKLFLIVKESDSSRQHVRRLGIYRSVEDIEQELQNGRHEIAERNRLYHLLSSQSQR